MSTDMFLNYAMWISINISAHIFIQNYAVINNTVTLRYHAYFIAVMLCPYVLFIDTINGSQFSILDGHFSCFLHRCLKIFISDVD